MRSGDGARDAAAIWDIAVPHPAERLSGVSMAGFRQRSSTEVDLATVPYPAVTLFIDLGTGPVNVDDATGRRHPGSIVAGLAPGRFHVRGKDIEGLQVRLSPVIAGAVLDCAAALDRSVVGLDDVWGADAPRLAERLRAAPSWDERFAIANTALVRRLDDARPVDPEVLYAWQRMVADRGQTRVDWLSDEVGWSRKRLWARFRSQIGLTPKHTARLVRFDHVAHRLAAGDEIADVAAEGGYADQSHLHREVMAFTGGTPTEVSGAAWLAVDDVAWGGTGTVG